MHLYNTATLMLSEEEINWTPGQNKENSGKQKRKNSVWIQCPKAVNSLRALWRLAAKLGEGHCSHEAWYARNHGESGGTMRDWANRVRGGPWGHGYELSHSRQGSAGLGF